MGQHFYSREEVEAHCSNNSTCMGFHVVGPVWRSCPIDSQISGGIGCTLYKKGKFKKSDSHKVFFGHLFN